MTDQFRALCAELLAAIQLYTKLNHAASDMSPFELTKKLMDAMAATDAALAQPEPQPVAEGPTDDEIEEWADACSEAPLEEMDPEVHGWRRCFTAKEFSETIRAALARWGRPTPQPPAEGEVAEMQRWGVNHGAQPGRPLLSPMEDGYWTPWHIAADLLQRLASDNAGLEAAAESAYLDNLSLLDSQND